MPKNNKVERIKALSPIIVAFIALIGTILVGWWQSYSASAKDLRSTLIKLTTTVEQLNKFVIPGIKKNFQTLEHNYTSLDNKESASRERIARIEGILETLPRHLRARFRDNPIKDNPVKNNPKPKSMKKLTKIPMINIQKTE